MKHLTIPAFALAFIIASCGNAGTSDPKEQADSTNEARIEDTSNPGAQPAVSEADTKFAVDAANGGMAEVQLGQSAQAKATDPKVKEFATMMVADHTKANEELKSLAGIKGITLPSAPSEEMQKAAADINAKTGKDFDKANIDQMVKDHKKTVDLFEDGQKNVKDAELKAFIDKTLPVLRGHLDHIQTIEKSK